MIFIVHPTRSAKGDCQAKGPCSLKHGPCTELISILPPMIMALK